MSPPVLLVRGHQRCTPVTFASSPNARCWRGWGVEASGTGAAPTGLEANLGGWLRGSTLTFLCSKPVGGTQRPRPGHCTPLPATGEPLALEPSERGKSVRLLVTSVFTPPERGSGPVRKRDNSVQGVPLGGFGMVRIPSLYQIFNCFS
jgi:hypothetical protein